MNKNFSRRDFLKFGGLAALVGTASGTALAKANTAGVSNKPFDDICGIPPAQIMDHGDGLPGTGDVDHAKNGFDPGEILYDFDYGKISNNLTRNSH